jgi:hypothetical protein
MKRPLVPKWFVNAIVDEHRRRDGHTVTCAQGCGETKVLARYESDYGWQCSHAALCPVTVLGSHHPRPAHGLVVLT